MIPKLIHQTAKTSEIPANLQGYVAKLRELHPDWHYHLWTDVDNLAFVKAEYPEFLEVWNGLPKNIMRADVIRYLLMYKLGGFYCDTDYEMIKPFDLNNKAVVLPWETDGEWGPNRTYICNSVFASSPGHLFWKMVIDDLKANPPRSAEMDVLEATGPAFLTRVYHRAKAAGLEMYSPKREYFSPPTPKSDKEYQAILKNPRTYGIHHCAGSWREYTLAQKIRHQVGRVVRKVIPSRER